MFKIKYGIRLRVTLALAIFCIIIVGALAISLYFASDDIEETHIEQIMKAEMDHVIHHYLQHTRFTPQIGSSLKSYVIRNTTEESQLPDYLQNLDRGSHKIFRHDQEIRVLVLFSGGVKFVVAYKIGLHEQRQREFRLLVVLSLVAVVAIAFLIGYLLAGLLVKQVTDLAERVKRLLPVNDSTGLVSNSIHCVSLSQPGQDEEVAQLARTLEDYQYRIVRMLQREQEFTANISHELRTPITTILTSCELLLAEEQNLSPKAYARIRNIETVSNRMSEQVQALLFLAR
ncbi:MAG TPA: histidine kinase dimerization/phospho-acceptor domain-containing protein, partial [Nitrosomonas nitrosa]|nr:histidine kinase dimerization/phospho-acceptor domain-containing protein [Nitrosomonas nitrosa]